MPVQLFKSGKGGGISAAAMIGFPWRSNGGTAKILAILSFASAASGDGIRNVSCGVPTTTVSDLSTPACNNRSSPPGPEDVFRQIVGGMVTSVEQWPWQVHIYYTSTLLPSSRGACGGTLLPTESHRWILTAAHCVVEDCVPQKYRVVLSQNDASEGAATDAWQDIAVVQIVVHPRHNALHFGYNDIALLKLARAPRLGPTVQPICLPEADTRFYNYEELYVTGYGKTEETGGEDKLKYAKVQLYPRDQCREVYPGGLSGSSSMSVYGNPGWDVASSAAAEASGSGADTSSSTLQTGLFLGAYLTDHQICGGCPQGGQDFCLGDSGGPAVRLRRGPGTSGGQEPARWEQVGIVSYTGVDDDGCGSAELPGVYVAVPSYMAWIREAVKTKSKRACLNAAYLGEYTWPGLQRDLFSLGQEVSSSTSSL